MIISDYRDNMLNEKKNIMITSLSKLSQISKKYKLKLCVALVSNRKEKVQKVSFNNEIALRLSALSIAFSASVYNESVFFCFFGL